MVKRGQIYGQLGTDLVWITFYPQVVDNFLDSTRIRYGFSMNLNWISDLDHI